MSGLDFDSFEVTQDLILLGSRRRPGRALDPGVRFIVVHDTGNPGASAANHARFYRGDPNPPLAEVSSAHIFVDDRTILELIPAFSKPEQALHVLYGKPVDNRLFGFDANRAAIGVEYCFGGSIDADEAYRRYVWTVAKLCNAYNLDPSRKVVGHQVLDPGRKVDPGQGLRASGRSYEMLLQDVVTTFRECSGNAALVGSQAIRPGPAETTVRLAVRLDPNRSGAAFRTLEPGTRIEVTEVVQGEPVHGIADWCRFEGDHYCWSGGLRQGAG